MIWFIGDFILDVESMFNVSCFVWWQPYMPESWFRVPWVLEVLFVNSAGGEFYPIPAQSGKCGETWLGLVAFSSTQGLCVANIDRQRRHNNVMTSQCWINSLLAFKWNDMSQWCSLLVMAIEINWRDRPFDWGSGSCTGALPSPMNCSRGHLINTMCWICLVYLVCLCCQWYQWYKFQIVSSRLTII